MGDTINATPTTCRARAEAAAVNLKDKAKDHPGRLAGLSPGIKDLDRVAGVRCSATALIGNSGRGRSDDRIVERTQAELKTVSTHGRKVGRRPVVTYKKLEQARAHINDPLFAWSRAAGLAARCSKRRFLTSEQALDWRNRNRMSRSGLYLKSQDIVPYLISVFSENG